MQVDLESFTATVFKCFIFWDGREGGELTTGRHSVPPCTSSGVDPSSKLGGSGCNGCFPRCNENISRPSESSRSRNPRWMRGRLRAGGHKGVISSWNSQFIPCWAVRFGFNGIGVTCQLTWACCVRGISVVRSRLILDFLNLRNKAANQDVPVLEKEVYLGIPIKLVMKTKALHTHSTKERLLKQKLRH